MDGIVDNIESLETLDVVRYGIRDVIPLTVDHPAYVYANLIFDIFLEFLESFDTNFCEEIIDLDMHSRLLLISQSCNVFSDKIYELLRSFSVKSDIDVW